MSGNIGLIESCSISMDSICWIPYSTSIYPLNTIIDMLMVMSSPCHGLTHRFDWVQMRLGHV